MAGQDFFSGFDADSFQKEQILRRLRAKAIQLWGLQETDVDNLDPVIDLLLGACAVEFERTGHEIIGSQARVLARLAQLMVPEVITNARPAHAVMHGQAEGPRETVKAEAQFSVEAELLNGQQEAKAALVFSPVTDSLVFDASIKVQATGNKVIFYDTPFLKGNAIQAAGVQTLVPYTLWLGIAINKKITNLQGMTFFFDWKNEPDKARFLPLLSLTQWTTGNTGLKVSSGMGTEKSTSLAGLETMSELESQVLGVYQNQFLTLSEPVALGQLGCYPAEFESVFTAEQLKNLKEDLLWVRVRFPEGMSLPAITDLYCSMNCFPVMNRKLHLSNRPYALSAKLNIVSLQTEEHFIAIRRVYSDTREYRSVSLQKVQEAEDGSYSVRQGGVARFDQRNAASLLNYLYELLRDESAAFSAYNNYALNAEIRSLEQSLSRLQMHFMPKILEQSLSAHLLLHTRSPEDVWVEFWSCQGASANRLPAGKKMNLLTPANLKKASLLLMTLSSGGREPMNESEKLQAYKYTLLTRSRIVTEEDIKAACYAELGSKIKGVSIKKGVKKDPASRKGFVRTLDVVLTPATAFEAIDWPATCRELQAFLERKKMFLTSIQVYANVQAYVEASK